MEKIEFLLDKLDNRITSSLAKRLDTLDDLSEKLEASSEDYEKNPTDACPRPTTVRRPAHATCGR